MKNRDVGEMGESIFKVWAAQVGITANKVQQDKTGWDFLVEFSLGRETLPTITLPLDKAVPPMRCLIQVKSTDNRKGQCAVKLSNWWRFVSELVPAFCLVVEFDTQPNPQRAFLVHVDESYIGRVLQRLREIPPGEQPPLHKRTMHFTYEEKNALETLNGEGLEQAIRQHAGENPLIYAENKLHILQRVGYEDVKAHGAFDILYDATQGNSIHEYLVDFALGLTPSMQITNLTHTDMRFGIPAPEPSLCLDGQGELRMERVPVGELIIRLRTEDGQAEYRLPAQIYPPRGFGHLVDQQYLKIRCAAPCIDFVFWVHQPRVDVRFQLPPFTQMQQLSRLMPVAALLLFLDRARSSPGAISIGIGTQAHMYVERTIPSPSIPLESRMVMIAKAIHNAWTICKFCDLHEDTAVNIRELLEQRDWLWALALALGPDPTNLAIAFWSSAAIATNTSTVCILPMCTIVIGQYRLVLMLAVRGCPIPTGGVDGDARQYEVRATSVRVERKHIYGREEPIHLSPQQALQSIVEDYARRQIPYVILPAISKRVPAGLGG